MKQEHHGLLGSSSSSSSSSSFSCTRTLNSRAGV
jgi:hypothetical protein